MPEPAGDGQQVHDRVGRPADRGQRDDRVVERGLGQEGARPAVGGDQLDGQPPGVVRGLQQPAVRRRRPGHARAAPCPAPRRPAPSSRRCPSCCSGPRLRIIADSERVNCSRGQRAGPDLLRQPPDVGAAAERHAAEGAGEHRAAGHDDGRAGPPRRRPSAATGSSCRSRRAARRRRSGWPAASPRWPSRPCCATASRSAGPASRRATPPAAPAGCRRPRRRRCFTDAGHLGQVRVARGQVGGGVGDGDLRAPGRTRRRARRGASRRGGCRRCGRRRRTTRRCAADQPVHRPAWCRSTPLHVP